MGVRENGREGAVPQALVYEREEQQRDVEYMRKQEVRAELTANAGGQALASKGT